VLRTADKDCADVFVLRDDPEGVFSPVCETLADPELVVERLSVLVGVSDGKGDPEKDAEPVWLADENGEPLAAVD